MNPLHFSKGIKKPVDFSKGIKKPLVFLKGMKKLRNSFNSGFSGQGTALKKNSGFFSGQSLEELSKFGLFKSRP